MYTYTQYNLPCTMYSKQIALSELQYKNFL